MSFNLSDNGKLLLLVAFLSKDNLIPYNSSSFLKELILRRDPKVKFLLDRFESDTYSGDSLFLEKLHNLIEEESFSLYNDIFSETSLELGKSLSKDERDKKNLNEEKSLIYGEVDYQSFYKVLRKIHFKPGGTFYDLGSGTGKAVIAARLTRDFSKCIGIEILHGLHDAARFAVQNFHQNFRKFLNSGQTQHTSVYHGSFLEYDWSDGDVVFANSTCFDDNLMLQMAKQAESLKPGSIFVTFTKGLTSKKFEVLERKRYKMSWGPATVFIHRRLNQDGSSIGPSNLNILPSDRYDYDDQNNYNSAGGGNYEEDDEDEDEDEDNQGDDDDDGDDDDFGYDVSDRKEKYESGGKSYSSYGTYGSSRETSEKDFKYENLHDEMSPPSKSSNQDKPHELSTKINIDKCNYSESYNTILNSPQDSALLMRKRASANRMF